MNAADANAKKIRMNWHVDSDKVFRNRKGQVTYASTDRKEGLSHRRTIHPVTQIQRSSILEDLLCEILVFDLRASVMFSAGYTIL